MENQNQNKKRQEGAIPRYLKKKFFMRRFTDEEKTELKKLEKESYMIEARKIFKQRGEKRAKEQFEE